MAASNSCQKPFYFTIHHDSARTCLRLSKITSFLGIPMLMLGLAVIPALSSAASMEFDGSLKGVTITDSGGTNAPPSAVISHTTISDTPLIVDFDARGSSDSDGSIQVYKWEFGDGTTADGATVRHQFVGDFTNYPVTLAVTDDQGAIALSQVSIVNIPLGPIFYWSMDTLPATTIISDIGDATITKHRYDGTSAPGVSGNCLEQTDTWQAYRFPMTIVPTSKGRISFWAKHSYPPDTGDSNMRYFFKSTNVNQANSIYAYTYKNYIFFYVYDSQGNLHRTFKTDVWNVGQWYQYEFNWDTEAGSLFIKRDDSIICESNTSPWSSASNWGTQDFYMGYVYPIGCMDEFYIFNN